MNALETFIPGTVAELSPEWSGDELVAKWIKLSGTDSDEFKMWCTVSAMMRTGLCAQCLIEDSSSNFRRCVNPECDNYGNAVKLIA